MINEIRDHAFCLVVMALLSFAAVMPVSAQQESDTTDVKMLEGQNLREVTVSAQHQGPKKGRGIQNAEIISSSELMRAACCNLGESFTTNPSVDVNYADAATGAQQIKLLGLSGSYVQMLTENIPNYRGAAAPYSLGYIPGPWMQSIQVSKGASSVKNGYESITGQINVEFKKPQATPFADANLYYNSDGKLEANLGGNLHLNERWSTALLGHYEILDKAHDDNGDGFVDMPKMRQGSLQNRWAWMGDHYVFQASVKGLKEHREGGQIGHSHAHAMHEGSMPYLIDITNERYEAFTKNAYIFDKERATNVALILSGSLHHENAEFGQKYYHVDQRNGYASLMFESDFGEHHTLSTGVSLNHDYFDQRYKQYAQHQNYARVLDEFVETPSIEEENTPGVYAQYTYKLGEQLVLMGGLRWDHSSIYGGFVTPRVHLKYSPSESFTLRASAGKGYRTVHALAENSNLLASSRYLYFADKNLFSLDSSGRPVTNRLDQEEAWNFGVSTQLNLPLAGKKLQFNAEYYYTTFLHQVVVDMDSSPFAVFFTNLDGDSYSHTLQLEATYPFFRGFTLTAAYRLTDVKCTYGGELREKPLTSKYKGLLTASYKPGLGKWQFDATLQLNGGGRMPSSLDWQAAGMTGDKYWWPERYSGYEQLSAQVTRFFRHWSIYAGGENLTGFKQKNPIIGADDPWGSHFDSTMIWGPIQGAMFYVGVRLNWSQL